jgi:hypothetical protein
MEDFDLLAYLIPGVKIYSVIHRGMREVLRVEPDSEFPIVVGTGKKGSRPISFNRRGSVLRNGRECLLFPDKDAETWEGYVTPRVFRQGEAVKAFAPDGKALVAIYSHFDKEKLRHCCFFAVAQSGEVEYREFEKVDKFRPADGYLYCKQLFSKMEIGRLEKKARQDDDKGNMNN